MNPLPLPLCPMPYAPIDFPLSAFPSFLLVPLCGHYPAFFCHQRTQRSQRTILFPNFPPSAFPLFSLVPFVISCGKKKQSERRSDETAEITDLFVSFAVSRNAPCPLPLALCSLLPALSPLSSRRPVPCNLRLSSDGRMLWIHMPAVVSSHPTPRLPRPPQLSATF